MRSSSPVLAPAGRSSRRAIASAVRATATAAAAATGWALVAASVALAASPEPSQAAGGDPRSAGQGPGLVGDPLFAIALVAAIGLAALAVTLLYVRATGGARRP
jgi:hypothetical protein